MWVEFIFASQYKANLIVMPKSEAENFQNGKAYTYYSEYSVTDNKFGIIPFEIPVGEYVVGIDNQVAEDNTIRIELQQVMSVEGFEFQQNAFTPVAKNIAAGTRMTQPITMYDTARLLIDGGNTGGEFYLIPASEQSNFLNGRTFQYLTDNPCDSGSAAPGFCELKLAVGEYALAYHNDTKESQAVVFYGKYFVPKQ